MPKKKTMGQPKYAVWLHVGEYFFIIICLHDKEEYLKIPWFGPWGVKTEKRQNIRKLQNHISMTQYVHF
jgi:hypothetical protein